ncbi:hypothetical protein [Chlorogloeopsis sp. ULAP02]|uniref:hypothetical protein n=1 Tax=Chlorogloeopsis sp. ULAP02 TaxID=3107926 RepID=UPI0031358D0D
MNFNSFDLPFAVCLLVFESIVVRAIALTAAKAISKKTKTSSAKKYALSFLRLCQEVGELHF